MLCHLNLSIAFSFLSLSIHTQPSIVDKQAILLRQSKGKVHKIEHPNRTLFFSLSVFWKNEKEPRTNQSWS
ncbi:MAG: hypothetical protein J3R72DRAFT_106758 [Linnemannia gamsii]|nr:MAG: hypothetical protein J3R72DRAFT_106758 [Linnemannia gamsii]